jgi:hypothetical protein
MILVSATSATAAAGNGATAGVSVAFIGSTAVTAASLTRTSTCLEAAFNFGAVVGTALWRLAVVVFFFAGMVSFRGRLVGQNAGEKIVQDLFGAACCVLSPFLLAKV